MFNLSDAEKQERYVEFYDMCDIYKSETIPEYEVSLCMSSHLQDLTKLHAENIPGSPLASGWYKNWGICCAGVASRREEHLLPVLASPHRLQVLRTADHRRKSGLQPAMLHESVGLCVSHQIVSANGR